jgi:hypothetical protein
VDRNFRVEALLPDHPAQWTQTGADGTFELSPPVGALVTLVAHPPKEGAGPDEPFQYVEDPERSARAEDVPADGPEVTLVLP